jgi:hypothetical protein
MQKLSLRDRLACAFLGAIFGALYGGLFAIVVGWLTDGRFHWEYFWAADPIMRPAQPAMKQDSDNRLMEEVSR